MTMTKTMTTVAISDNPLTLDDDMLLLEQEVTATLEDGSRHPLTIPVTVGMVRAYRDDPDPCRCEECLRMMRLAVPVLALQEARLAGRITEKRMERELKRLGFRPYEVVTHQ
jgi:hypothetical protein